MFNSYLLAGMFQSVLAVVVCDYLIGEMWS